MKIGRFTLSAASLALLIIQLLLVSTVAAKYLYQRWTCPRVWTRAAAIDPNLPMRGRYLSSATHCRWLPKHAALGQDCQLPARREWRRQARAVCSAPAESQPAYFHANLKVVNNKLVAVRVEGQEDPTAGEGITAMPGTSCDQMSLDAPVDFLLREAHAKPAAAQARPGALGRSHRSAQRPAAPHASGAKAGWRLEAAGVPISRVCGSGGPHDSRSGD